MYAPTRNDREQWVKILSTIAEMNQNGIRLAGTTPFDYIRQKEIKKDEETQRA